MKVKDKNETDRKVIAQTNDKTAWSDFQLLKNRAKRGSREKFLQALSKVPKVEPAEEDRIDS